MLAEPEVQELLGSVNRVIVNALRKADTKMMNSSLGASAHERSVLGLFTGRKPDLCPPPVADKPAIPPQPLPCRAGQTGVQHLGRGLRRLDRRSLDASHGRLRSGREFHAAP